jgi:ABC-type branched-subunit amino acid transport system substrate-binding protein
MDKRQIWKITIVLLIMVGMFLPGTVSAAEKKAINILSCTSITGRARDMVYPIHWGVQAWFDYLNAEKGGIEGHPVNVIVADGKYDVPLIRSIYKKYKNRVSAMTFTGQSVAYDALLKDFKRDKMPVFALCGGPDAFVYPPGNVFTPQAGSADKCGLFAQWIAKNWKKDRKPRLALLLGNYPAGRFPEKGIPYYESLGIDVVAVEHVPFNPTSTMDNLTRIRDAKADFIYDTIIIGMLRIALSDASRMGWKLGKDIIWSSFYTNGVVLSDVVSKEFYDGFMGFEDTMDWYDQDNWRVKKLTEYYRKRYKTDKYLAQVGHAGASGSMMTEEALRLTIKKKGFENLTPETVLKEGFYNIRDYSTDGYCPTITVSKDEPCNRGVRMVQYHKDKKPTVVIPFTKAPWVFKWIDENKK